MESAQKLQNKRNIVPRDCKGTQCCYEPLVVLKNLINYNDYMKLKRSKGS